MNINQSALEYAEGWLSFSHSETRLGAGYAGARFAGYRGLRRLLQAYLIARELKARGLEPGFDLRRLG